VPRLNKANGGAKIMSKVTVELAFTKTSTKINRVDPAQVAAAIQIMAQHGYSLTSVDDVLVAGVCEACSSPILDGDQYYDTPDGVLLCKACGLQMEDAA
jgi:hypothetical protein